VYTYSQGYPLARPMLVSWANWRPARKVLVRPNGCARPTNSSMESATPSEQEINLGCRQEVVQYENGHTALLITGATGAKFDLSDERHKYSPAGHSRQQAIVHSQSGNDYYIAHTPDATYVVDTRESDRTGTLVAARTSVYPAPLPPIEFGKPWGIEGKFMTTPVEGLLLRYKDEI
jgi:hypothetical protein